MKAFVLFPTICIFVFSLTLLKLNGQTKSWIVLSWATIVTATFGGLMILYSVEVFEFLFYSNFLGVLVCIPCLTYLLNKLFKKNFNQRVYLLRVVGLSFVSTLITAVIAGTLILFAFINNPMDPPSIESMQNIDSEK
jgi:hypothetical protein